MLLGLRSSRGWIGIVSNYGLDFRPLALLADFASTQSKYNCDQWLAGSTGQMSR